MISCNLDWRSIQETDRNVAQIDELMKPGTGFKFLRTAFFLNRVFTSYLWKPCHCPELTQNDRGVRNKTPKSSTRLQVHTQDQCTAAPQSFLTISSRSLSLCLSCLLPGRMYPHNSIFFLRLLGISLPVWFDSFTLSLPLSFFFSLSLSWNTLRLRIPPRNPPRHVSKLAISMHRKIACPPKAPFSHYTTWDCLNRERSEEMGNIA